MRRWPIILALALTAALGGCTGKDTDNETPGDHGGDTLQQEVKRPELVEPFETALQALLEMNETGRAKDFVGAEKHFRTFRENWARIRPELQTVDPRLGQHIEDGAVELDVEFKKPGDQIRVYELDEETVKLGRLLSEAAVLLGVPVREELIQRDPREDLPFNKEVTIEVTLVDHKILPEVIEVDQHDQVTFVITNEGQEVHEFELGHFAVEVEDIQPGETRKLTLVVLDAGDWEMACHLPGHYEVGMHGILKVKPAPLKPQL